jgi:signal transduction histidine kinase
VANDGVEQFTPLRAIVSAAWAVAFVGAAALLTRLLTQSAERAYFILFVPAVMFSAWFGGAVAGLLASALTVVATILLLDRAAAIEQFLWVIAAAIVSFGTSVLTTARRRAELRLTTFAAEEQARRRTAESLSELRTDVLAQVAHELRQPLSAISVAAQLLKAEAPEHAKQRALGVVVRQSNHLRELLEDLLGLAKLTRRELQLRKARLDLCEIIDDTVHTIAADLAGRRLELSSSLPECPVHMTADPTRLRQILSNLLSNAVKFTPDGGQIHLAVERTSSHVLVRIRDTGRGIPPERLPHIFEMFHTNDIEGAGLGIGLAVVKGLIELHGGSVDVHSPGIGCGSEFIVRLPVLGAA